MLTLRSYRDYPLAFSGDRGREFLSPPEKAEFDGLSFGPGKSSWLLSRIATKELVQRYCDVKLNFVPDISDVVLTPDGPQQLAISIVGPQGDQIPALHARYATSDHYVVSCLRKAEAGEGFSVSLDRVEARYPFANKSAYTEAEWDQVRFAAPEEADRVLAGLGAVKDALHRASEPADALALGLLSLRGDCEVDSPTSTRSHAGCWYFDHHVMAIAFTWRQPHLGPMQGARVEEEPVLPEARHSEITL